MSLEHSAWNESIYLTIVLRNMQDEAINSTKTSFTTYVNGMQIDNLDI